MASLLKQQLYKEKLNYERTQKIIRLKENIWERQSRFSDSVHCPDSFPVLESAQQFTCSWKSFIHMTRCTELRQCPHLDCQLLWTRLFGFIPWSPGCLQPKDTTRALTFNPITQLRACQAGFLVLLMFQENALISPALWFYPQANTCHETDFPISFFHPEERGKKPQTISQQS